MSYDLELCTRRKRRPPKRRALREYFSGLGWYEVSKGKAEYFNEDTGVYFSFSWRKLDSEPDPRLAEHGLRSCGLSFNINYLRSHVFALEAAMELEALVAEFRLRVDDPQIDGMGTGRFDREGFLRGYHAGNALAHRVKLTRLYEQGSSARELTLMPAAQAARSWRWNFIRRGLADQLDGHQVPRIMFAREGQDARRLVTWSDAVPTALPVFDYAMLHRSVDDKLILASFDELQPMLQGSRLVEDAPVPFLLVDDEAVLERVAERLQDGDPAAHGLKGVHTDQILDLELVTEALEALRDE